MSTIRADHRAREDGGPDPRAQPHTGTALIQSGGGTGPLKPGNRPRPRRGSGANSDPGRRWPGEDESGPSSASDHHGKRFFCPSAGHGAAMTSSISSTRLLEVEPIRWADGRPLLLDQSRLPLQEVWLELVDVAEVAAAIKDMRVRGAPAIGVTAAYGVALAARASQARDMAAFQEDIERAIALLRATRPTA